MTKRYVSIQFEYEYNGLTDIRLKMKQAKVSLELAMPEVKITSTLDSADKTQTFYHYDFDSKTVAEGNGSK